MARVRVIHGIDDLASDLAGIGRGARRDMVKVVRQGIKVGATVARDNARRTAGTHGKYYPRAITSEMNGIVEFGGSAGISGEFGPDIAKPQGGMEFERGSRNQPPHNDLAKSADLIGPAFAAEVGRTVDTWFW